MPGLIYLLEGESCPQSFLATRTQVTTEDRSGLTRHNVRFIASWLLIDSITDLNVFSGPCFLVGCGDTSFGLQSMRFAWLTGENDARC